MDFDFKANNHTRYCMENAIWDVETGCILKLDQNKKILAAVRAFELLDSKQI